MCPLCASSAALTAAAATTATAIGMGFDLIRLFTARWQALKEWFLRSLVSGKRSLR
jgi:hypothetical protein